MKIEQQSQNFCSPGYTQETTPRWQTVAKWAVEISLAAFGMGLAVYAYRNDWLLSGLPNTNSDPEDAVSEGQIDPPPFDSFYHYKMPFNQYRVRDFIPAQSSVPGFSLNAAPIALLQQDLIQKMNNQAIDCELVINGTLPCEEGELVQIFCPEFAANATLPCEEGEADQEWLVCEDASKSSGLSDCALLKNVCTSSSEKPRSFLASAGSGALKWAARAGSKICSTTINAGEAALRTLGWASYRTGRMCVKGLLAAKVSHETLGTCDPNPYIIKLLSGTPLGCLTHDIAPLLRHHGFPLR